MKRKYQRGSVIRDPDLVIHIIRQGRHLYWRDKVQNAGWMQNQTIRSIEAHARAGYFAFAHPIRERKSA
ncbi:hypothetical protein H7H48_02425 [Nitratireductor sp. B36]|uniref:hypothetical protein n=1 Tax=Nitratireductor sp. B36 TaxID=2762059 RepID=UPI001E42DD5A|nr:hypothetical protein [Nitratireductor sp. B36]MCC5777893.1 hypothetical protein [Nitratireductor sp. B36]